jgi:hypothetical protein
VCVCVCLLITLLWSSLELVSIKNRFMHGFVTLEKRIIVFVISKNIRDFIEKRTKLQIFIFISFYDSVKGKELVSFSMGGRGSRYHTIQILLYFFYHREIRKMIFFVGNSIHRRKMKVIMKKKSLHHLGNFLRKWRHAVIWHIFEFPLFFAV